MRFLSRLIPAYDLLSVPNIRWLVLSRFFSYVYFNSTTIVLFQSQRGLNFTEMFLMESIISASIWLCDIPTGALADRFGYRRLIVIGRATQAIAGIVFVFAYGFWPFALANALNGIGIACLSGCESAMLYSNLSIEEREQRGTAAFALLNAATSAGFFLGLSVGSFIGAYSPTLAAAATFIPTFFSFVAATRLQTISQRAAQSQSVSVPLRDLLRIALQAIRKWPVLVVLSCFDTAAFVFANSIFWYNQTFFAHAGIAVMWFGPITALAMALQTIAALKASTLRQYSGTRFALILSCLLPGCAFIALAATRTPLLVSLLVGVIVACPAWRQPIINAVLNKRIPDSSRATTLSALSFIAAIVGITLNPFIGHFGDMGIQATGLGLGSGLLLLCLLVPFISRGK